MKSLMKFLSGLALIAFSSLAIGQAASPIAVSVAANLAWQAAPVNILAGQQYNISVSGSWTSNPATGFVSGSGNPSYAAKPGYTLPGAPEGALVGRIGNNAPFLVGVKSATPVGQTGLLQFCINDDLNGIYGAGLSDNAGSLVVTISLP